MKKITTLLIGVFAMLLLGACGKDGIDTNAKAKTSESKDKLYTLENIFTKDNDLKDTSIWYKTEYTNYDGLSTANVEYVFVIDNDNKDKSAIFKYEKDRTMGELLAASNTLEMISSDANEGISKQAKFAKDEMFKLSYATEKEGSHYPTDLNYFVLEPISDGSLTVEPIYISGIVLDVIDGDRAYGEIDGQIVDGFIEEDPVEDDDFVPSRSYFITDYFENKQRIAFGNDAFKDKEAVEIKRMIDKEDN